jgi:hypothetical protein
MALLATRSSLVASIVFDIGISRFRIEPLFAVGSSRSRVRRRGFEAVVRLVAGRHPLAALPAEFDQIGFWIR